MGRRLPQIVPRISTIRTLRLEVEQKFDWTRIPYPQKPDRDPLDTKNIRNFSSSLDGQGQPVRDWSDQIYPFTDMRCQIRTKLGAKTLGKIGFLGQTGQSRLKTDQQGPNPDSTVHIFPVNPVGTDVNPSLFDFF